MPYMQFLFALFMLGSLPGPEERALAEQASIAGVPRAVLDSVQPAPQAMAQVRIEQRIIIRVPRQSLSRSSLLPMPTPRQAPLPEPPRFERRKIGKCLAMRDVTGVRVVNNEMLVLFMRDQRMIEAQLERTCSAREFYQGFYMERSGDGRLCVDRDLLQARSGSKCEVERLRQLVPDD